MKRKLIAVTGSIALLCALAIPVALRSAAPKPAPSPAAPAATPDRHPEYHDALDSLRTARKHLEKAEADGYGNRDRAMQSVDAAIDACNQALQVLH
jgi:hypothetical protein